MAPKKAPPRRPDRRPPRKPHAQPRSAPPAVPLATQQRMLDVFISLLRGPPAPADLSGLRIEHTTASRTSPPAEADPPAATTSDAAPPAPPSLATLRAEIQEVKGHLYERAFDRAFGEARLQRAYALRWSPTRALAYHELIARELAAHIHLGSLAPAQGPERPASETKVVCLGAGAGAELVAFAELWRSLPSPPEARRLRLDLLDIAPWSGVLDALAACARVAPRHVPAAQDTPADSTSDLSVHFAQHDALSIAGTAARVQGAALVTLLFTLNELYASSRAKATALLLALGEALEPGAQLLVVDSPGSYSSVGVGAQEAQASYPMGWLLDHTLLEVASGKGEGRRDRWEKVYGCDARWFRVPPGLEYPLDMENMRYQVHVYIRV